MKSPGPNLSFNLLICFPPLRVKGKRPRLVILFFHRSAFVRGGYRPKLLFLRSHASSIQRGIDTKKGTRIYRFQSRGKAEGENLCPSPPSSASSGQPNDSSYEELANDFDFNPCPGTNASRLYFLGPDRPLPVAGDYLTTGPESSSSHPSG